MGRLDGKVAFITGAARGQGRAHAVRLAQEGADIIAIDICADVDGVALTLARPEDLEETTRLVEALDRRVVASIADVRDLEGIADAVSKGVAELGRLDIVSANAGVWGVDASTEPLAAGERQAIWDATVSINLNGVWNTLEASVPHLLAGGRGGAIVITASTAAFKGMGSIDEFGSRLQAGQAAYGASKHALIGLMRSYAKLLAKENIRVNCLAPTGVRTDMTQNQTVAAVAERYPDLFALMANQMPVDVVEPEDLSEALLYLVADSGRYVTGSTIPVDAGFLLT